MATYSITDIVACMRNSAKMLEIADHDKRPLNILNCKHAELLRAAADDLEARDNSDRAAVISEDWYGH
jgi:hypothetical protein